MVSLEVSGIADAAGRQAMAVFPWSVYRGDKNWVPPLIKDREKQFDPQRNRFFKQADVALFGARRDGRLVGTIAAFVDRRFNEYLKQRVGFFGFFEVLDDYEAAEALLGTARDWVRDRGMTELRGPLNFHRDRERGVLVSGADCPPPMLCAHSPPYYGAFMERFGLVKHADDLCRRVLVKQILGPNGSLPPRVARLEKVARRRSHIVIRHARFAQLEHELRVVQKLYDATIGQMPDHVPFDEEDIANFARELRPVLQEDFALFGEIDGEPVGCAVAFPDLNQVLFHVNGRLDGWRKLVAWWYLKRIDILSFKIGGVLETHQGLGIEALLVLEMAKAALRRGFRWVDLSLNAEENDKITALTDHFGAEEYKRYRTYKLPL